MMSAGRSTQKTEETRSTSDHCEKRGLRLTMVEQNSNIQAQTRLNLLSILKNGFSLSLSLFSRESKKADLFNNRKWTSWSVCFS